MDTAAATAEPLVKDTTTAGFRQDVIAESMKQPVLVDFWAPWCGPCKQLGPIIEKAVAAAKGKVKLVKLDIDKHPDIPGQLRIQSIPAVIAFSKGQPVDGFVGNVPESQVKAFIEKLAGPSQADAEIAAALAEADKALAEGDAAGAAEIYGFILQQEPEHARAFAGLAKTYIALGEIEQAKGLLGSAPDSIANDPAVAGARAALEAAEKAASLGDTGPLLAAVERDPKNHQARFDLALAFNARNKREEAADQLLEIIRKDRAWNEDGARKQLVQFFEAWGHQDDASIAGRRRLSSILFS